jgi:large subunit ribosomal protein LP1
MAAVPSAQLSLQERDELLCTYAALILHAEKMEISAENISKVLTAAGAKVEAYWPSLFARAVASAKIGDLLQAVGTPGAAAAPAAAAPAGGASPKKAAAPKKEEKVEEEEADMGFSLFD